MTGIRAISRLPKSLEATLRTLKAAGYDARLESEIVLINSLQRLLAPFYRDGELKSLLADGLAEKLPVKTYRAWLTTLPPAIQQELHERWGEPEKSAMAIREGGESYFVIPRFAARCEPTIWRDRLPGCPSKPGYEAFG